MNKHIETESVTELATWTVWKDALGQIRAWAHKDSPSPVKCHIKGRDFEHTSNLGIRPWVRLDLNYYPDGLYWAKNVEKDTITIVQKGKSDPSAPVGWMLVYEHRWLTDVHFYTQYQVLEPVTKPEHLK